MPRNTHFDPELLSRLETRRIWRAFGDEIGERLIHNNAMRAPWLGLAEGVPPPPRRSLDSQTAITYEELQPNRAVAGKAQIVRIKPEADVAPAERIVGIDSNCSRPDARQQGAVSAQLRQQQHGEEELDSQEPEATLARRHDSTASAVDCTSRRRRRSSSQPLRRNSTPPVSRLVARPR